MAGYWMIRSTITDQDAFAEYARLANPVVARYEGRFIAFGGRSETKEGGHVPRNLIIEFPTYEQAVACYEDADYQASLEHARKAMTRELVIVDSERGG